MAMFLSTVFSTLHDKDVNSRFLRKVGIFYHITWRHIQNTFFSRHRSKASGVYILTDAHDGDVLSLR
jgi:hypothetical protein